MLMGHCYSQWFSTGGGCPPGGVWRDLKGGANFFKEKTERVSFGYSVYFSAS